MRDINNDPNNQVCTGPNCSLPGSSETLPNTGVETNSNSNNNSNNNSLPNSGAVLNQLNMKGIQILYFEQDFCSACQELKPNLDLIRNSISTPIEIRNASEQSNLDLARALNVRSTPSLVVLEDGQFVSLYGAGDITNANSVINDILAIEQGPLITEPNQNVQHMDSFNPLILGGGALLLLFLLNK